MKYKKSKMTLEKLAVIIQQDFNRIDEKLAVKIDKEDLEKFATKEDLEKFATKEDLENFATKEDLRQIRDDVLTGNDKVIKELGVLRVEQMAHKAAHDRVDEKLEDHEIRLMGLETVKNT